MIEYSPLKILIFVFLDFFLGFVWHSPMMFAKAWMKCTGMTEEKIKEQQLKNPNMGKLFATQICFNIMTILCHAYLMVHINPENLCEALTLSFITWLGFTASAQFGPILWENKSINYFLITSGWRLTSMMLFSLGYYLL